MENTDSWTRQSKRKSKKQWANTHKLDKNDRKRQRTDRLEKFDKGELEPVEDQEWQPAKEYQLDCP